MDRCRAVLFGNNMRERKKFTAKKLHCEKTGGINFYTGVLQVPENICKGD